MWYWMNRKTKIVVVWGVFQKHSAECIVMPQDCSISTVENYHLGERKATCSLQWNKEKYSCHSSKMSEVTAWAAPAFQIIITFCLQNWGILSRCLPHICLFWLVPSTRASDFSSYTLLRWLPHPNRGGATLAPHHPSEIHTSLCSQDWLLAAHTFLSFCLYWLDSCLQVLLGTLGPINVEWLSNLMLLKLCLLILNWASSCSDCN